MENQIMVQVAQFMELAARTAPKGAGKDYVVTQVLEKSQLEYLSEQMVAFSKTEQGKPFIERDAGNILNSDAVLLVGLKDPMPSGLNCGACGFDRCVDCKKHDGPEFNGPVCALRLIDLGIALGSAGRTAMQFAADNRMMYSAGSVAIRAGLIDADIAIAIPLSASGKNIFFDRGRDRG